MIKCLFRITLIITGLSFPLWVGAQTHLLSLQAEPRPKAIRIDWKTINEHHSARFVLLCGSASTPSDTCYQVAAAGESAEIRHYSYTHRVKADSTSFYLLKLIHLDGSIKSFPLLQATALAARDWEVYPNPSNGEIHIDPKQYDEVPVSFQIFDITGREQLSGVFPAYNTRNVINLRDSARPSGVYYLRLFDGQDQRGIKIILM